MENYSGRISFSGDLNLSQVTINATSLTSLDDKKTQQMITIFNKYGWVMLELSDKISPRKNLLAIREYFGNTIHHNCSDMDGVTIVQDNIENRSLFKSQGNAAHPLHTGGTAINNPPKVVALYCVNPARSGGLTQIMSSKYIFDYLQDTNPQGLRELTKRDAVIYKRGNERAQKAVFDLQDNGRYFMSFRYDDVAEVIIKRDAKAVFKQIVDFRN